MLLHDAFYHYGVPGMRWGIRKLEARADIIDKHNEFFTKQGYKLKVGGVLVDPSEHVRENEFKAKVLRGTAKKMRKVDDALADKEVRKRLAIGAVGATVLTGAAVVYGKHLYNAKYITNSAAYIKRHGATMVPSEREIAKAAFEKHISQMNEASKFLRERYTSQFGPDPRNWPTNEFL